MVLDQRNNGALVNPAVNGIYYLDRWLAVSGAAGKFSIGQNAGAVTPPEGFTNYLGLTSLSAYTAGASEAFTIRQTIEGFNIADLGWGTANAKTITISFWVRSSLTGTFGGALRNDDNNRSYPFSYTIPSANTWTQISVTIVGETTGTWLTNNGRGIQVIFSIGAGATVSSTAGAWAAGSFQSATGAVSVVGTSGATFYITGVQLEVGSSATSFEYRPFGTELALCQRYCYVARDQGGTPFVGGAAESSVSVFLLYTLPVPPRATPTLGFSGTIVISDQYSADPTASPPTISTAPINSTVNGRVRLAGFSGLVTGRYYGGAPNLQGITTFSMEL
jgi:hypothetical protein